MNNPQQIKNIGDRRSTIEDDSWLLLKLLVCSAATIIIFYLLKQLYNSTTTMHKNTNNCDYQQTNYVHRPLTISNIRDNSQPHTPSSKIIVLLHNHFKVEVDVELIYENHVNPLLIARSIKSNEPKNVVINRPLQKGSIVLIKSGGILLSKIWVKEDGMKEIHFGMNTAHYDISVSSEPAKSPLGTALPRLRIVNTLSKTINLNTFGDYPRSASHGSISIPPGSSVLYFGQYQNGLHIGVRFTDVDGVLDDFVVTRHVTDLFLGVAAPQKIFPYTGAKIGGEFDYTTSTIDFPLTFNIQYHKGSEIDRTYIPKNW